MPPLKELADQMTKYELEYAGRLKASAAGVRNPIVRIAMEAVAQDSVKHSLIYRAISEILNRSGPLIGEREEGRIASEIESHIRSEQEMIERVEGLLKENQGVDGGVKFLLESMLRDERYHHALLKAVHDIVIQGETLSESDVWDMAWKEAVWHGTPGG